MGLFRRRSRARDSAPRPTTEITLIEHQFSFTSDEGETVYGRGYRLVGGEGKPLFSLEDLDSAFASDRAHVCKVAGVGRRQQALQSDGFAPGRQLCLVPDPKNAYDPNAIEVRAADGKLMAGFIPRENAAELARLFRVDGPWQAMCLWEWRTDLGGRIGLQVLLAPGLEAVG